MDTKWKSIDWKKAALASSYFLGVTLILASFSAYADSGSFYSEINSNRLKAVGFTMFFIGAVLLFCFFVVDGRMWLRINRNLAERCRRPPLPYKVLAVECSLTVLFLLYELRGPRHSPSVLPRDFWFPAFFWLIYLIAADLICNRHAYQDLYKPFFISLFGNENRRDWYVLITALVFAAGCVGVLYVLRHHLLGVRYLIAMLFMIFLFFLSALIDALALHWRKVCQWNVFSDDMAAILSGQPISVQPDANHPLAPLYRQVSVLQDSMEQALQEQVASERTKAELITNVSHDLKTPITSLTSYIELLKREEDLSPAARDYVAILEQKTQRLQAIVQDVFDISKAVSGQLPIVPEPMDFRTLLEQTVADQSEAIEASPCPVRVDYPEHEVMICTDGDRMYRVFQNLIQNALQYSLNGSRIYLTLSHTGDTATAVIKNTSREEISPHVDYSERFFRGDASRSTSGSGLGLSIAKTFTERCGGTFQIHVDGDWFTVSVSFPMISSESSRSEHPTTL